VAVDPAGQFYFENQLIPLEELKSRLQAAVKKSADPLTLLVQADKDVKYETLVNLTLLARAAGIKEALLATLPRDLPAPPPRKLRP
jgi:biopolymer transport protein ExbD